MCKDHNLDYTYKIDEQITYYKSIGIPEKSGLYQCGVIARRHTPEINRLCEKWWSHIIRFSWRDQISFPVIFKDFKIGVIENTPELENEHYIITNHLKIKKYGI